MNYQHIKYLSQKHAPEIYLAGGLIGITAPIKTASKATLRVNDVLQEAQKTLGTIQEVRDKGEEVYSPDDLMHDELALKIQTVISAGKLYVPSLLLGIGSTGLILASHGLLKTRNSNIMAAYALLDRGYRSYRKRVANELGSDVDEYFKNPEPNKKPTLQVLDEKKKAPNLKPDITEVDLVGEVAELPELSMYARYFDANSPQWRDSVEANGFFLQAQNQYANDLLHSRGHIFLNEVYDMLGLQRSSAGAVVGWADNSKRGDGFVLFDTTPIPGRPGNDGFLAVDFNVDGVIYDLL